MALNTLTDAIPTAKIPSATINDPPRTNQNVTHDSHEYSTIKEGLAYILVPHGLSTSTNPKAQKDGAAKQSVFYNPIQQFNRDLSVLAIRAFGEDFLAAKKLKAAKHRNNPACKEKNTLQKAKRKLLQSLENEAPGENADPDSMNKKRKIGVNGNAEQLAKGPNTSISTISHLLAEQNLDLSEGVVPVSNTDEICAVQESAIAAHSIAENRTPQKDKVSSQQSSEPVQGAKTTASNGSSPLTRGPDFKILDALSATGLRALRYAQEIPFATSVTANDMSQKATASIALNVKHNRLEDKITPNTGDATAHMYSFVGKKGYDVIDLDPYGTAAPFLDSALQALNDGGLLCVTCTDSGVFASAGYPEKTYSQYGGLPIKGFHSHEGGLRLILHAIASSAARYGIAIEPLLSLSIDYYIRVFVRIRKSPAEVKFLAGKTMLVYNCDQGCFAWQTQFIGRNLAKKDKNGTLLYKHSMAQAPTASQLCEHCGRKTHLAGPMWGGPLHNPAFIERILNYLPQIDKETYKTTTRIEGMLQTAYEENLSDNHKPKGTGKDKGKEKIDHAGMLIPAMDPAEVDNHPFFFAPSYLSKVIHCQAPPERAMRGALRRAGFRDTRSHCKPGSIKTDAKWTDIWHIMREWVRQEAPLREGKLVEGMAGWTIMQKAQANHEDWNVDDTTVEEGPEVAEGKGSEIGGKDGAVGAADTATDTDHGEGVVATVERRKYEVVFDEELGRDRDSKKLVRYQVNPSVNWGPMTRAAK
ncbi:TRM-domain-containing protein [Lepidopterella palustris CBS 459.81]|uniref:tRNA (guanine(26)-N(2))-dimethyltransferase n=1 Tax=Lepidopterella palustris CBS 459.81 TaxID=1314670 RepID=A0A8E2E8C5_9PEZI|nr:TRM-domain-containing protein [Lepidopterella palustris CBS 459.81]